MNKIKILLSLIIFWVFRNTILVRGRTDYDTVDIYGLIQIAVVFILAGLLFIFYSKSTQRTLNRIHNSSIKWFFLIYILALISVLWSPVPAYSGYRAFEALTLFLATFVLFNSLKHFEQAEKYFLRLSLLLLLLTFIGQLKGWGFNVSINSLHTNTYSFIAMILFLYTFGELLLKSEYDKKRKKILKRYALVGFVFLLVGTSSASNISVLMGMLLLALFTNRRDIKIAIVFLIIPISVLYVFWGDMSVIHEILFPGKSAESVSGMSGRMHLWDMYLPIIYEKLYFGWGFSIMNRISAFYATNMHNSILSVMAGMGIIGLMVFFIFIISSIQTILRLRFKRRKGSLGGGAAFAGILVNAMSIGVIGEAVSPVGIGIIVFFAFFFISLTSKNKNILPDKANG